MPMDLSRVGVFCFLDPLPGRALGPFARKVEQLGYSALWFAETTGRESLSLAAYLLGQTERLIVASGIAVAYSREPIAVINAARGLAELYPDRFILGLGVSNAAANARRGVPYERPLDFMRDYLARMKRVPYAAPAPPTEPPVVLGSFRPRMIDLAMSETAGALTYFTPVAKTAEVRKVVPSGKWLCAEQAVLLESDPARARSTARTYAAGYIRNAHYTAMLGMLGYGEADFADGGSDRLLDAIVAWGSAAALRERIAAHYRAGATHVCILPLAHDGTMKPDEQVLEALAPG
jgi:probable F420-dependent oxidoreductase